MADDVKLVLKLVRDLIDLEVEDSPPRDTRLLLLFSYDDLHSVNANGSHSHTIC